MYVYKCVCVYMYIYDQFTEVLKTVNSAQKYAKLKQTQHSSHTHIVYTNIAHTPRLNLHCYQTAKTKLRSLTRLGACSNNENGSKAASQSGKQELSTWQLFLVPLGVCVTSYATSPHTQLISLCFYTVCICVIKFI